MQPNVYEKRRLRVSYGSIKRRDPELRDAGAEERAHRRENERFGEELSHNGETRRAERGANADFLGAMRRAVEQQIRCWALSDSCC